MIYKTTKNIWDCYQKPPNDIQNLGDKNFQLLQDNPSHLSLHFKKVGKVWSARIGTNYSAVSTEIEDGFLWIWIGSHRDYDRLMNNI